MTRFLSAICVTLLTLSVAPAQFDEAPLTSNQWVQPTDAGTLVGRVIVPSGDGMARAVEGASVTISSVDGGGGSGRAVTDSEGEFTISGVAPGVYTLTTRAENTYSHSAIQVIDSTVDLGGRFPNVAEIAAADMGYSAVSATLMRYRPPSNNRTITMANADLDALSKRTVNGETYRVSQFDGGVNGRLYAAGADGPNLIPSPMTNVFIMRNGVEVGRAVTDEMGDFRVDALDVGAYSLLAIGRDGMAAIGFDLVAKVAPDVAQRTADGKRLVSAVKAASAFGCQMSPITDEIIGEEIVIDSTDGLPIEDGIPIEDGFGTNMAGGGSPTGGSGYYGGGGGGGGGGGFGTIAGLAGIGGIIAATTSDDAPTPVTPPVVATPVLP